MKLRPANGEAVFWPRMYKLLPVVIALSIFASLFSLCFAQEHNLFKGRVNSDNINVRSDSTVSSHVICKVNKDELLEIIYESYDWYKIKMPKSAPSFIKKNLVALIDETNARVIKDNVNIRLRADESSPILGKINKGQLVNILRDRGEWLRIEPVNNSFGWINKKFIDKVPVLDKVDEPQPVIKTEEDKPHLLEENIIVEGIIRPKVVKRIATHKLIAKDNELFLIKGDKEKLNSFNYRKVKVTGKLISPNDKQKKPIVEVNKIEASD